MSSVKGSVDGEYLDEKAREPWMHEEVHIYPNMKEAIQARKELHITATDPRYIFTSISGIGMLLGVRSRLIEVHGEERMRLTVNQRVVLQDVMVSTVTRT